MSTLNKYWQKRQDEDGVLEELMYLVSSVFSSNETFDVQFKEFEESYLELVTTFVEGIESIVDEEGFSKSNWKQIKTSRPKLAFIIIHDLPLLCLNKSSMVESLSKKLGLESTHNFFAIDLNDLKRPLKSYFEANSFLSDFEKSMAFHRSFQIVYYNYMFGLMDELGESRPYNGSDAALSKDIVLRQEIEKFKNLGEADAMKKSLPLFNMEWETEKGAYEMAVSIGKSMYSRNSKEGFVLKPISCYFYHLFLKHKQDVKSEREYCRSLFDLFHVLYPWKNLIIIYGYREMRKKDVDTKFIELMSEINKPQKKSDRNYGGKYDNYRFKVSQNLMKDNLAYYNPIYINLFAEWRVSIDNNWGYTV